MVEVQGKELLLRRRTSRGLLLQVLDHLFIIVLVLLVNGPVIQEPLVELKDVEIFGDIGTLGRA